MGIPYGLFEDTNFQFLPRNSYDTLTFYSSMHFKEDMAVVMVAVAAGKEGWNQKKEGSMKNKVCVANT